MAVPVLWEDEMITLKGKIAIMRSSSLLNSQVLFKWGKHNQDRVSIVIDIQQQEKHTQVLIIQGYCMKEISPFTTTSHTFTIMATIPFLIWSWQKRKTISICKLRRAIVILADKHILPFLGGAMTDLASTNMPEKWALIWSIHFLPVIFDSRMQWHLRIPLRWRAFAVLPHLTGWTNLQLHRQESYCS